MRVATATSTRTSLDLACGFVVRHTKKPRSPQCIRNELSCETLCAFVMSVCVCVCVCMECPTSGAVCHRRRPVMIAVASCCPKT
eukprot:4514718-Amphidinium_carterae.1